MQTSARKRTPTAIAATALAGLAVTAVPHDAPAAVRAGHSVSVFANLNFVAAYGYTSGTPLTLDVLRGGHRIATVSAQAVSTPGGTGLEVNHGPAGAAQPGDCFEGFTPALRAGDEVRVTDATGTDSVAIDDLRFTGGAYVVTQQQADTDPAYAGRAGAVAIDGIARDATGATIPVARLDGGEVRGASLRANPDSVVAIAGVAGGWRAFYTPPFPGIFRGGSADVAADRQEILGGIQSMGYGHPPGGALPLVTQLVEGPADLPGPAPGCEAAPAPAPSAETNLDDRAVNLTSADLTVGGVVADAQASGPIVTTVDDGKGHTVTAQQNGVSPAAGQRGWSATVTRAQLDALSDGTLTVRTTFAGAPSSSLTIPKDTVAPAEVFASPAPGSYEGTQFVTLSTGDSTDVIRYRRGTSPTLFTAGGSITVDEDDTLTATVTDRAGNRRDAKAFAYTIRPVSAPVTTVAAPTVSAAGALAAAPQAPAAGPAAAPARPLGLGMLTVTPKQKRARVASEGVSVVMRLPEGTIVVRMRVYRQKRSGAKTLLEETLRQARPGLYRTKLGSGHLRRDLVAGRYLLEVTPGRSRKDLGAPSPFAFRVER